MCVHHVVRKDSVVKRFTCNELELAHFTGDLSQVTNEAGQHPPNRVTG